MLIYRPRRNRNPLWGWFLFAMVVLVGALTFSEVVEWKNGTPKLRKKRQEQLQRELNELEEAEQYALVTRIS